MSEQQNPQKESPRHTNESVETPLGLQEQEEQDPHTKHALEPAQTAIMAGTDKIGPNAAPTTEQNQAITQQSQQGPSPQDMRNDDDANHDAYSGNSKEAQKLAYDLETSGQDGLIAGKNFAHRKNDAQIQAEKDKVFYALQDSIMSMDQLRESFRDLDNDITQCLDDAQNMVTQIDQMFPDAQQATWAAGEDFANARAKLEQYKQDLKEAQASGASADEIAALQKKVDQQQADVDVKQAIYEGQADIINNMDNTRNSLKQEAAQLQTRRDEIREKLQNGNLSESDRKELQQELSDLKDQMRDLKNKAIEAKEQFEQQMKVSNALKELSKDGNLSQDDIKILQKMAGNDKKTAKTVENIAKSLSKNGVTITDDKGATLSNPTDVNHFITEQFRINQIDNELYSIEKRLAQSPEDPVLHDILNDRTAALQSERLTLEAQSPECYKDMSEESRVNDITALPEYVSLASAAKIYNAATENTVKINGALISKNQNDQYVLNTDHNKTELVSDNPSIAAFLQQEINKQLTAGKSLATDDTLAMRANLDTTADTLVTAAKEIAPSNGFVAENLAENLINPPSDMIGLNTATAQSTTQAQASEALTLQADPEFINASAKVAAQIENGTVTRQNLDQALEGASPELVAKIEDSLKRQGIEIQEPDNAPTNQIDQPTPAEIAAETVTPIGTVSYNLIGVRDIPRPAINDATYDAPTNGIYAAGIAYMGSVLDDYPDQNEPNASYITPINNNTANLVAATNQFSQALSQTPGTQTTPQQQPQLTPEEQQMRLQQQTGMTAGAA